MQRPQIAIPSASHSPSATNIKVFCRFRPFNKAEQAEHSQQIHRITSQNKQLIIKDPNRSQQISFIFDQVFDCHAGQEEIYTHVGQPVLSNILDGFNGTIMAYGQTSSGKTHTMQGHDINDKEFKGLIPRIIQNLFNAIERSMESLEFKLKVSIFELYMEKIRDLLDLSKNDLKIRENKTMGAYVDQLTQAYISDKVQFYKLMHLGQKNRATCMTNMNAVSSRSHMIFLLTLHQNNLSTSQAKTSKLYLIDLAGSEKVSKTGAEGKVLEQAKKINLSLTSLGMVIKSLSQCQTHVPYRDSKLTRIIKDSLGGNAKTTLIVACSPHQMHVSETISTLRFGENAQKIKNKPKINREITVPQLMKKIQELEAKIEEKDQWIHILEAYIKEKNLQIPKLQKNRKLKLTNENIMKQEQKLEQHQPQHQPELDQQPQPQPICKKTSLEPAQSQSSQQPQKTTTEISIQTSQRKQSFPFIQAPPSALVSPVPQPVVSYSTDYISSLQTQLSQFKQSMQKQIQKFYQLKKQYNLLSENLKEVIQQNIGYQEKEKEWEAKMEENRIEIEENERKIRKNCGLVFGEMLDIVGRYSQNMREGNVECYEKIKNLINTKGRCLCLEGQNINCFDYWNTQKQAINKKMQQVIDKSITLQKNLQKRQSQSPVPPPPPPISPPSQSAQNAKLILLQSKLDSLYSSYQQMLTLQANWKVECQLYERKLKMKQEKITELRTMLEEMQEQMELIAEENDQTASVNTKIIKPIRGGFLFR